MSTPPRKVSLRFLREGPTHNHLLSPLTPYLATVGRNDAVTVRMPYEHRHLLRDLSALRYGAGKRQGPDLTRAMGAERRIIADSISAIFEAVPGLNAEIGTAQACHPGLVHLELVFSAAELSMLPFELTTSPRGFPGEGLPLSVQVSTPIVMTRTVPTAPGRDCRWNIKPRILFAWASPPDLPPVPHQAHLAALIKALAPWTGPLHEMPDWQQAGADALARHLVVLPQATRHQIEEACRSNAFTHVHLLAHGTEADDEIEPHYAVALHDESGHGTELLNAERLQAALRLPLAGQAGDRSLSHPLVVTLATCDSGQQSQVITPGMSLAHAVHTAGVPLVVGSLFPLTYGGSVSLAESLYTGLLGGQDPRWVLYETRHRLFRRDERSHDWAGMVAYASFADDIGEQSTDVRYLASCASIDAHLAFANKIISGVQQAAKDDQASLNTLMEQFNAQNSAVLSAEAAMPVDQAYLLEGHGMRASAEKRRSRLLFDAARVWTDRGPNLMVRSVEALRQAQQIYRRSAQIPPWAVQRPVVGPEKLPTLHWVLTQSLSLAFVLTRRIDQVDWYAAIGNARLALSAQTAPMAGAPGDPGDPIWAHGSLMELYLLASGVDGVGDAEEQAFEHLRSFLALANNSPVTFFKSSTRAQLERYVTWWFDPAFAQACGLQASDEPSGRVAHLAKRLIEGLGG